MLLDALMSGSFDMATIITSVLSSVIVIFICLPFHEFAHALIADKMGDPTARYSGRLTVNPLAHIDYIGALMILLVGFGYAKPVPVSQHQLRRPKLDMALIALAGPVANLVMAFALLLIYNIYLLIAYLTGAQVLAVIFPYVWLVIGNAAFINVSLAVFNLIPVPPLDGSRILFAFAPDRIYYTIQRYEQYIIFVVFALIFSGALDVPLSFVSEGLFNALYSVAELPFRLIYSSL